MRKFILGTLAVALPMLAALLLSAPQQARAAIEYPWCAAYSEKLVGATNCGFVTQAQCRATISGLGGICYENPAYIPPEPATKKRVRTR